MYLLKVKSKNIFSLVSILKVLTKRAGLELDLDMQVIRTVLDREPYQNVMDPEHCLYWNPPCAQLHFWVVRVKAVVAVSYHPLQAVVGIRDIFFWCGSKFRSADSHILEKMDPAPDPAQTPDQHPDPTPDPTPFFSDYKGTWQWTRFFFFFCINCLIVSKIRLRLVDCLIALLLIFCQIFTYRIVIVDILLI